MEGGHSVITCRIEETHETITSDTPYLGSDLKCRALIAKWDRYTVNHEVRWNCILTPRCRVLLEKLTGLQLVEKFPTFLWNPKFHYSTHKRPPPVPILGQPNPVHIPTYHFLEIHSNIIHPSTPRSPQCSLSLRFPHQDPIRPPLLTHTRHMPSPSHSSRFYHPHDIG